MFFNLLIVGAVVALDQVSKALVVSSMQEGAATPGGWGVRLRHVANRRDQWQSSRGLTRVAVTWMLVAIGTLVLAMSASSITQLGLSLAIGGATGNAIDAVFRRRIIDFIDLRVWPVFNLADAAIVAGPMVAVWNTVVRF